MLVFSINSFAHEIRPAYLKINEVNPGEYDVLWRVPVNGGRILNVYPVFDKKFNLASQGDYVVIKGFALYRYKLSSKDKSSIQGTALSIENLIKTAVDTIVDVKYLNGDKSSTLLGPTLTSMEFSKTPTKMHVVKSYTKLGIEHILTGFDHLLFVLCLILLTTGKGNIVKTITAFTVAHSITLSMAALGFVHVPGAPVEATIALSIMFLAIEIIRNSEGKQTLTSRAPWLVAFTFGLLHGFGFAGALSEIGLPQSDIPLSLMFFNVGVEIGQLLFVSGVVLIKSLLNLCLKNNNWMTKYERFVPYSIGAISSFWMIERIMLF
ncbi:HupE/UreJ family protein [Vibrio parahaemolyticus]|uniref:HupE/UreJ family protein n=1 Tax=Vibrio parahaemolyticus TaxID=670 RepID=UPI00084B40AA|nr:HupE/UreJ family protein [Vibrio parahaemolyticus]ODX31166.1 hypothetical protein BBM01_14855 [Vibrio parahaemolyticus]